MRDLVIIPAYFRPEYLWLCLEHIQRARRSLTTDIWIVHDCKKLDEWKLAFVEVNRARLHFPDLLISGTVRQAHNAVGNTLNFLQAYKDAYSCEHYRYVYLIEEDVLISEDFFEWHEAVQEHGNVRQEVSLASHPGISKQVYENRYDYFCSVGWHCVRNPKAQVNGQDPKQYIESAVDFSSIGVCWKREQLAEVVKHATPHYYYSPSEYLAKEFPSNPIRPNRWVEQAGLIMRILLEGHGRRQVAWAVRSRCGHIGTYGYHRLHGARFEGATFDDRVVQLRKAILEDEIPGAIEDINAPPAALPWKPEELYVSQRF